MSPPPIIEKLPPYNTIRRLRRAVLRRLTETAETIRALQGIMAGVSVGLREGSMKTSMALLEEELAMQCESFRTYTEEMAALEDADVLGEDDEPEPLA